VEKWNIILVIQGGKDFRVPIGQGQEVSSRTTAWNKESDFIFPRRKSLGFKNAQVWQKNFQMAEKNVVTLKRI
jgi:hypothetical protein